jgi:hypothetical protein
MYAHSERWGPTQYWYHYSLGLAGYRWSYQEAYRRLLGAERSSDARPPSWRWSCPRGRAAFGAGIVNEIKPNIPGADVLYPGCIALKRLSKPSCNRIILCQARERWAKERAIELYSLATRFPYVSNSHWLRDTAGLEIEGSFRELPLEFVDHALARGRNLEVWSTAVALQQELSHQGWPG